MLRDEFKAKDIKEYPKQGKKGESLYFYFTFETRDEATSYHSFMRDRSNIYAKRIFLNFFSFMI